MMSELNTAIMLEKIEDGESISLANNQGLDLIRSFKSVGILPETLENNSEDLESIFMSLNPDLAGEVISNIYTFAMQEGQNLDRLFNIGYDVGFKAQWSTNGQKETLMQRNPRLKNSVITFGNKYLPNLSAEGESDQTNGSLCFSNEPNYLFQSVNPDQQILSDFNDLISKPQFQSYEGKLTAGVYVSALGISLGLLASEYSIDKYRYFAKEAQEKQAQYPNRPMSEYNPVNIGSKEIYKFLLKQEMLTKMTKEIRKSVIEIPSALNICLKDKNLNLSEILSRFPNIRNNLNKLESRLRAEKIPYGESNIISAWNKRVDEFFSVVTDEEIDNRIEQEKVLILPEDVVRKRNKIKAKIAEEKLRSQIVNDLLFEVRETQEVLLIKRYLTKTERYLLQQGMPETENKEDLTCKITLQLLKIKEVWLQNLLASKDEEEMKGLEEEDRNLDTEILETMLPIVYDVAVERLNTKEILRSELVSGVAEYLMDTQDSNCKPLNVEKLKKEIADSVKSNGSLPIAVVGCPYLQPSRLLTQYDNDGKQLQRRGGFVVMNPFKTDTLTIAGLLSKLSININARGVKPELILIIGNTDTEDVFPEVKREISDELKDIIRNRFLLFAKGIEETYSIICPEVKTSVVLYSDEKDRPNDEYITLTSQSLEKVISDDSLNERFKKFANGFEQVYRGFPERFGLSRDSALERGKRRAVAAYVGLGNYVYKTLTPFFVNLASPNKAGQEIYQVEAPDLNVICLRR